MSKIPKMTLATIAVLVSIFSVQAGASFSKHLFPIIGAEGTTALRQTFATVCLFILFQPWRNGPERKHWPIIVLYGTILGVMNLTFYLGIARIPLGIGVAIEFLGPLTVTILSSRRLSDFVWVGCAVAGLALLLPWNGTGKPLDMIGCAWALLAGVCWGVYIVVTQKVSDRMHGGKAVALGMAFSTLFTLPIGMVAAGAGLWSLDILPWGIGVGILSGAVPYTLEMLALKHVPVKTFGLMMSLEPAVAALLALVILGELLTPLQWLAVGLVIVASAGSSLTAKRAKAEVVV